MSKNRWLKPAVTVFIVFLCSLVLYWAYAVKLRLPCPIYCITGLRCPSCGATGAIISLLHGDVHTALAYNAFIVIAIIPVLFFFARFFIGFITGNDSLFRLKKSSIVFIIVLFALFLLFGIVRNIPSLKFL